MTYKTYTRLRLLQGSFFFIKKVIINQEKKNLFSDTETECRWDDSKTDISWLREPKSKPQLIDYSRNKNVKKSQKSSKKLLFRGMLEMILPFQLYMNCFIGW